MPVQQIGFLALISEGLQLNVFVVSLADPLDFLNGFIKIEDLQVVKRIERIDKIKRIICEGQIRCIGDLQEGFYLLFGMFDPVGG